jgi:hypothetical protein
MSTELIEAPRAHGGELVEQDGAFEGGLLTPELVAQYEKQVDLVKRMRLVVCRLTEPAHWQDFGGVPYLKDGGIHVIASTIGVEFGEPDIEEIPGSDEKGEFMRYECRLSGKFRGRMIHELGTSSTRDPFFALAKGQDIPFGQINLGYVKKKSITNAQHRVLAKMTGLSGVTWELLHSIGINRGDGGTIRFKGQERRQATGAGEWTQEKQRVWGMLLEIYGGAEDEASQWLHKATDNPSAGYRGITDPKDLTAGVLKWLAPKVEKEWRKRQQGEPAPDDTQQAPREPGQEG